MLEVNKLKLSPPLDDSADLPRLFDIENAIAWKIARQVQPGFSVAQQTFLPPPPESASARLKTTSAAPTRPPRRSASSASKTAVQDAPTYAEAQLALGKELYTSRQFDQAAAVLAKVPQSSRLALEANFT